VIIRNFKNSGSAVGAVNYVLSNFDSNRTLRNVPPKILRGDVAITKIIDKEFCQKFQHKSLSGVLSFRAGEAITEQQKQSLIDDFEKAMFGNMRSRVNALYVEHGDKKGNRLEIHYVINRVDLDTGKFFNPCPPGQLTKELVKTFSALKNQEYGFKAIEEDPLKTKYTDNETKGRKNSRNGFHELKGKVRIDRALMDLVKDGTLKNRAELLGFLGDNNMKLSRIGNDYISIEKDGRNIRLRGGIYADTGKDYQIATLESRSVEKPTYAQNLSRLNEIVAIRNQYNSQRFNAKIKIRPALMSKLVSSVMPTAKVHTKNEPQAIQSGMDMQHSQSSKKAILESSNLSADGSVNATDSQASDNAFDSVNSAMTAVSFAQNSLSGALAQLANAKTPDQQAKAKQLVSEAQAKVDKAYALLAMAKICEINAPKKTTRKIR
jgi:hypothetical protein